MKFQSRRFLLIFVFISVLPHYALSVEGIIVKVATFNVEAGKKGGPDAIAKLFVNFQPDILAFNEVPGGNWSERVGEILDMNYVYVGKISSANHKNKYKSILSRTPLMNTEEFRLSAKGKWGPASAVKAATIINDVSIAIYSLHVAASRKNNGHTNQFFKDVLSQDTSENILVMGDFNNKLGTSEINVLEEGEFRPIWRDLNIEVSKETSVVNKKKRNRHGVIDHIFYKAAPSVKALKGGLVDIDAYKPLSDHKPIWALMFYPLSDSL